MVDTAATPAAWRKSIASNSPQQTRSCAPSSVADAVDAALDRTGLPASRLCLELTERQAINAGAAVRRELEALRALGVGIAIDDFGTGRASIEYLRELPFDMLKIDRLYISGLGRDRTDTALTTAMVALGRSLGLTVVAEGVETSAQREAVRTLGCHVAQGYLLARPMSAGAAEDLIAASAG